MSRAVESINTVALSDENHFSIEEIASKIGEEALRRFEYSTYVFVKLKTELFHRVKSESGKISVVSYPLTAEAVIERDGKTETSIEVEVTGINACPCAMETARTIIGNNNPKIDGMLDSIPGITHNQRNHVTIKLTTENDENIEAFELINSAEKVLGGSLLPVLKRIDEGEMVVRAHSNPMFVEDIVRFIVADIIKNKDISDDSKIEVSSESEESIHPHNAFATISGSIGEFRKNNSI